MKNVMVIVVIFILSGDSFEFRILSVLLDIIGYSLYIVMKNVVMVIVFSIILVMDGIEFGMLRSSDVVMRYVVVFVLEILNMDVIIWILILVVGSMFVSFVKNMESFIRISR